MRIEIAEQGFRRIAGRQVLGARMDGAQPTAGGTGGRLKYLLVWLCLGVSVPGLVTTWGIFYFGGARQAKVDPTSRRVRSLLAEIRAFKFEGQGRPDSYVVNDLVALGPPAVPALKAALGSQDHPIVRMCAIEALGKIRDPSALPDLIRVLQSNEDETNRCIAARSIGDVGDPAGVPALLTALTDPMKWVRMMAADGLGAIGDARAGPALMVAMNDAEPDVRKFAASALGRIRSAQALPTLIAGLQDRDSAVRFFAAKALGDIGDSRALVHLRSASNDQDGEVRSAVTEAIKRIEGGK